MASALQHKFSNRPATAGVGPQSGVPTGLVEHLHGDGPAFTRPQSGRSDNTVTVLDFVDVWTFE